MVGESILVKEEEDKNSKKRIVKKEVDTWELLMAKHHSPLTTSSKYVADKCWGNNYPAGRPLQQNIISHSIS